MRGKTGDRMVLGEQAKASQLISVSDAVTTIIMLKALRRGEKKKKGRDSPERMQS